jgi:hypothetical protein
MDVTTERSRSTTFVRAGYVNSTPKEEIMGHLILQAQNFTWPGFSLLGESSLAITLDDTGAFQQLDFLVLSGTTSVSIASTGLPLSENILPAAYIFVDLRDRDLGSYVADAQKAVATQVKMPSGYYVVWSGDRPAAAAIVGR